MALYARWKHELTAQISNVGVFSSIDVRYHCADRWLRRVDFFVAINGEFCVHLLNHFLLLRLANLKTLFCKYFLFCIYRLRQGSSSNDFDFENEQKRMNSVGLCLSTYFSFLCPLILFLKRFFLSTTSFDTNTIISGVRVAVVVCDLLLASLIELMIQTRPWLWPNLLLPKRSVAGKWFQLESDGTPVDKLCFDGIHVIKDDIFSAGEKKQIISRNTVETNLYSMRQSLYLSIGDTVRAFKRFPFVYIGRSSVGSKSTKMPCGTFFLAPVSLNNMLSYSFQGNVIRPSGWMHYSFLLPFLFTRKKYFEKRSLLFSARKYLSVVRR